MTTRDEALAGLIEAARDYEELCWRVARTARGLPETGTYCWNCGAKLSNQPPSGFPVVCCGPATQGAPNPLSSPKDYLHDK